MDKYILLEPLIHSHLTDDLPEDHPLAYDVVFCDDCEKDSGEKMQLLHASNNECMQTWVEFKHIKKNVCVNCFSKYDCIDE